MQDASARKSNQGSQSGESPTPSASSRVENSLCRIAELEPQVHAFVHLDEQGAREAAAKADSLPATARGALFGVPTAVKEIFDVAGLRCTWGTPIHKSRVPATDAAAVTALKDAGAIVMGTVASTAYAIADTSPTRNPWNAERSPGASSSGSAAAVGAGMVPLAIGTQTIGSTIRPAAYCGVIGFKPTWDTISLDGAMPLSSALDHVGIFSVCPNLLRTAYRVLRTTRPDVRMPDLPLADGSVVHVLAPWSDATFSENANRAIEQAAARFGAASCPVQRSSLPANHGDERGALMDILCRDMAENHGGDRAQNGDQMNERVRSMIDRGGEIDDRRYAAATSRAAEISAELHEILGENGVFLTAATDDVAPPAVEGTGDRAAQRIWTLAGMPAITVPIEQADGLPIGVQLIGPKGSDERLISISELLIGDQPQ
ncbi:MAG: amidase [Alphaproteobacteria bacterium]|nr:amidase [Alphaproteobacteria bacterium]